MLSQNALFWCVPWIEAAGIIGWFVKGALTRHGGITVIWSKEEISWQAVGKVEWVPDTVSPYFCGGPWVRWWEAQAVRRGLQFPGAELWSVLPLIKSGKRLGLSPGAPPFHVHLGTCKCLAVPCTVT